MKKLSTLLFAATVILAACKNKPENPVKSILIKHTELGRSTMFKIACDRFDQYFPNAVKRTLTTQPGIDSVTNILNKMTSTDDTDIDVRAQLFLTHADSKIDTVCIGVTNLKYKGATYQTPQELLQLVQQ